jgi:hypothetical protein
VPWVIAVVILLVAMRFGMRGLLFGLPLAALIVWSNSRPPRRASAEPGGSRLREQQMTREEALRVLGLDTGATAEAITKAHRELIKKVHPDHGGSSFLTQQVNEAKRVLLKA